MGGMVYSDTVFLTIITVTCFLQLKMLLNFIRHQAREAEPKDYDIKDYQPQKRNLHNSTYHRIGNVTDGVRRT